MPFPATGRRMTTRPSQGTSNRAAFRFPTPLAAMEATGERYVSGLVGDIQSEHYHRYLFALRFCAGSDVLDVASGEGYGSALLGQVARSVIGVDLDAGSVRFANSHYISERVSFRRANATALPIEDASVDVVVSFETIEHLADHAAFLAEIRRVLRPGGVLVISSPDHAVYSEEASHQNPFHVKELRRAEFLALMRENFPHVVLLEQRAIHGSVILRAGETGTDAPLEGFDTPDGTLFERSAGVPAAPYLIAVCALGEAPVVPGSVMNTPPPALAHGGDAPARGAGARRPSRGAVAHRPPSPPSAARPWRSPPAASMRPRRRATTSPRSFAHRRPRRRARRGRGGSLPPPR